MKIQKKIFIILILVSIIPSIIIAGICIHKFTKNSNELMKNNIKTATIIQSKRLKSFFSQKGITLKTTSQIAEIQEYLSNENKKIIVDGVKQENINSILKDINNKEKFLLRMSLINKNDVVVASSDENIINKKALMSGSEFKGLPQDSLKISNINNKKSFYISKRNFVIGYPIWINNEYQGFVSFIVDTDYIKNIINDIPSFNTGKMIVIDSIGNVVANDGKYKYENIIDDENFFKEWDSKNFKNNPDGFISYSEDHIKNIGYYSDVSDGWFILSTVEASEIMKPIDKAIIAVLLFMILIIFFICIISVYVKKHFLNPMGKLLEGIEKIKDGDMSIRFNLDTNNEYAKITTAFNSLIDTMVNNSEELKRINDDLKVLTANIPGGVYKYSCDGNYRFNFVNEGYQNLLGYTKEELELFFENKLLNVIYEDDREIVKDKLERQLKSGNILEVEYRVVHSDGEIRWLLDKGQIVKDKHEHSWVYCVVIDITSSKSAQERLDVSEECYRIVMDQENNIVFEWNLNTDTVNISDKWEKKFGYKPVRNNLIENMLEKEMIYKDDIEKCIELFTRAMDGDNSYNETELRFRKGKNEYIWCKVRLSSIIDKYNQCTRVIGVVADIDKEKRKNDEFKNKAQRDLLTGLYNKITTEDLVRTYLENEGKECRSALFIIDIDDFKGINDNLGHLFGDAVLNDIASKFVNIFRDSDIIGRIGGDEFLILLKNLNSEEILKQKADELMSLFRRSFTGKNKDYKISGSIGIAIYPQHGKNFNELFRSADNSLYVAKDKGKDCYWICESNSQTMDSEIIRTKNFTSVLGGEEDIDEAYKTKSTSKQNLSEYIFRILYESKDVDTAVNFILELVGRSYNVSRAYVFENSDDNTYCSNTFEWCNDGIEPEIENLKEVSYSLIGDYKQYFNERGIFYCKDISTLNGGLYEILEAQGIVSMLQCAILDEGEFSGYVGFDDCNGNRFWTKDEIESLTFISEILSVFLINKHKQDKLIKSYETTKVIMDNLNSWTYVINKNTYELLFINQKTLSIAPNAKINQLCYKAFWGRDEPCDICPMNGLNEEKRSCTIDMYNDNLNVWSSANASYIEWNEEKGACLMCCNDITKYKVNEYKV